MKKTVLALAALMACSWAYAVELAADAPQVYVVQKGDTLWDIAGHFLKNPWSWPEVWQANPQVENPHLIYPGDVLALVYVEGQPRVERTGGPGVAMESVRASAGGGNDVTETKMADGTIKLQPAVRVLSEGEAIATIPRDVIEPFLTDARVVNPQDMDKAAYVVASQGEHVVVGAGDRVYVRGAKGDNKNYSFFRPGPAYKDPDSGEILGYEALYVGAGVKGTDGDPATFEIRKSSSELRVGDRAMPVDDAVNPIFTPRPAPQDLAGRIIAVYGGVTQIGQYAVVVLSRGEKDGIRNGHTMRVWAQGKVTVDHVANTSQEEKGFFSRWFAPSAEAVKLPDEQAGTLMVFRTFDRVSLALVMKATRVMHVGDVVKSPDL